MAVLRMAKNAGRSWIREKRCLSVLEKKEMLYYRIKTDKKRTMLKGSFTVEAALLMTIILPVLIALIYIGFYVHDSAVIQSVLCETAAMGSNLEGDPEREALLEKKKEELLKGRLIVAQQVSAELSVTDSKIVLNSDGTFCFPGMISQLVNGGSSDIQKKCERKLYHPAETIWKIRGIKTLADTVMG